MVLTCEFCDYEMPEGYLFATGESNYFCVRCGSSRRAKLYHDPKSNSPIWLMQEKQSDGTFLRRVSGRMCYDLEAAVDAEQTDVYTLGIPLAAVLKRTFQVEEEWYIEDVLTREVAPFSYEEFIKVPPFVSHPHASCEYGPYRGCTLDPSCGFGKS